MERIIENVFSPALFNKLVSTVQRQYVNWNYDKDFGRYGQSSEPNGPWLIPYLNKTVPLVKDIFKSETLEPSYALAVNYKQVGDTIPNLPKHKDNNACTYTLDVCLYQDTPWSIWVEGKEYWLEPNQAIVIFGEDELHWREEFTDKENNNVGMLFCHYIEPGHWWHTGERRLTNYDQ